jgi:pimeloyl-ACP methyl ester carboxylesterase
MASTSCFEHFRAGLDGHRVLPRVGSAPLARDSLILLHGGAVDARFFDHNVGAFADRLHVITTDLWGHGRSADRDGPFSLDAFASDVAELIERVAGAPAHVLKFF